MPYGEPWRRAPSLASDPVEDLVDEARADIVAIVELIGHFRNLRDLPLFQILGMLEPRLQWLDRELPVTDVFPCTCVAEQRTAGRGSLQPTKPVRDEPHVRISLSPEALRDDR